MTQPIRVQRKRTKGFNLQAESSARNGLPCVYVGRPTQYGNPFKPDLCNNAEKAVNAFRALLALDYKWFRQNPGYSYLAGAIMTWQPLKKAADVDELLQPLRGKNLACWCAEDAEFCHADILLEMANK